MSTPGVHYLPPLTTTLWTQPFRWFSRHPTIRSSKLYFVTWSRRTLWETASKALQSQGKQCAPPPLHPAGHLTAEGDRVSEAQSPPRFPFFCQSNSRAQGFFKKTLRLRDRRPVFTALPKERSCSVALHRMESTRLELQGRGQTISRGFPSPHQRAATEQAGRRSPAGDLCGGKQTTRCPHSGPSARAYFAPEAKRVSLCWAMSHTSCGRNNTRLSSLFLLLLWGAACV